MTWRTILTFIHIRTLVHAPTARHQRQVASRRHIPVRSIMTLRGTTYISSGIPNTTGVLADFLPFLGTCVHGKHSKLDTPFLTWRVLSLFATDTIRPIFTNFTRSTKFTCSDDFVRAACGYACRTVIVHVQHRGASILGRPGAFGSGRTTGVCASIYGLFSRIT